MAGPLPAIRFFHQIENVLAEASSDSRIGARERLVRRFLHMIEDDQTDCRKHDRR